MPPFPFPLRGKPGRAGSPHAGSTLRASQKRWHASLRPAPPSRGLPPPCESPAGWADRSVETRAARPPKTINRTTVVLIKPDNLTSQRHTDAGSVVARVSSTEDFELHPQCLRRIGR